MRFRKEIQIFKEVYQHSLFGDHVQEVRFEQPICLTGIKVGAAPGSGPGAAVTPHIHLFAYDLSTLGAARFAVLTENCSLPTSGTKAVRIEAIVTNTVVLRGHYQTLPVALYGWTIASDEEQRTTPLGGELAFAFDWEAPESNTQAFAGMPFSQELPKYALEALKPLLAIWERAGASERRLKEEQLPAEVLSAVNAAADRMCSALPSAEAPLSSPAALYHSSGSGQGLQQYALGLSGSDSSPAALPEEVAEMAAVWTQLLVTGPVSGNAAKYGLAGIAACLLVVSCPRYAAHFLAVNGVAVLSSVLALARPPFQVVRYALAALEAVTRACGPAGCDVAMGWWCPPLPASWSPQLKDVKANGVMPKQRSKEQVSQQGAQGSGSQVALQPMERTPASAEPIESDAMASVKPESIKEDDSAAEQQEAHDQRTENASMGEEPHDDQEALEDEHVEDEHAEHNDDEQHGDDVYEQEGQENAGYDIDVYDNINGQGDAGEEAHAGEGGEDDYGQVYDDVDVGEDPQVDEEAMQDQAEAPEDYADDEDLYNDIVPGIGQVDGEWGSSDEEDRKHGDRWGTEPAADRWPAPDPHTERWTASPAPEEQPPAAGSMLDDMLAETPERLSSGATDVITPKAANGTKDAAAERAASERPENHKEAKRKREEIKWEPGSAQKAKKSRSERAGSREHKHKHKEKSEGKEKEKKHKHKEKEKSKEKEKEKEREPERDREKDRDRERDREREREQEKEREREEDKQRDRERERERARDRDRDRREKSPAKDRRDRSSDRDARRAPSKYEERGRDRALSSDRNRLPEREREKERERPLPRDLLKEARERREAARKEAEQAAREKREADARQPPARHALAAPREPARRPDDRERQQDRREHLRAQEVPSAGREAPVVHTDRHIAELAAPREELPLSVEPQVHSAVKAEPQELQHAQNERQPGKRQRQAGADEKGHGTALAKQQRRERDRDVERARDRIRREREAFGGCYAPVLEAMLQPLPKQVAVFGARLLARLSVVGAVAKFQEAAEELARMHALNASPDSPATQAKIQEAATCLTAVADSLAASGQAAQQPVNPIVSALQGQDVAKSFGAPVEPDSCALATLAARRALHLVAACMHVPAVHASMLEQSGLLQPPSTAQVVMTRLGAPLMQALQRLLAVLLSSAGGQDLVLHNLVAMGALLKALDPEADPYGPVFATDTQPQRGTSEHLATVLRAALAAGQAAGTLVDAVGLHSPRVTAAVRGLVELLPWEPARRAALCAIACRTGALNRLLDLVRDPLHPQPADVEKPEQQWRAGSLYGAALLQALIADDQPQSLQAWATAAPAVLDAIAEAQAACSSSEEGAQNKAASERLVDMRSRVESMLALREKGIDSLFSTLDSILPPLVASDAEEKDKGKKKLKPPRVVKAEAAKEMLRSPAKRAKAETALHLLHAVVAGTNGAHIGLAAADVTGIQVCDRALRTALAGLQASEADEACAVLAGDALDDMAVATNRLQVLSFLAASAKATNALLQRMTHARVEFNSSSLLESLLASHRCCSTSVESLSALSGSFALPGTSLLLQARQALARALKAWVENENWAPELMPAILAAGKSPAAEPPLVAAQGPHEMLACASLLGDLFPAAWPPSGAARPGQGSHAPPAHMRYRAALAKSFEPMTQEALRTLMACAAASDSLIFRAALVRLCARASGLGGGMGGFVVKPLQEELAEACQHDKALGDARRCLEVLVPLAYRPAIKAAMLDSGISVTLGQLLARLLPALTDASKAAEAAALTTMVLEIVNVLCNLDICLDPAVAPEQRALEDCIPPNEAASVVAVLLAGLTRLGGNAYIAKRLIMMLAAHAPSRSALRTACARWRAQATGLQDNADGSNAAAVQWAISRLWQQGQGAGELGMQAVFTDVANALTAVAAAEDDSSAQLPSPAPAPQRFAAAVQAALASDAQPLQGDDELAETSDPTTLVYDSATRMFWRNVNARSGNAPVNKLGRKPARYDIPEDIPVPPAVELLGEGFTAVKRPREARLGSGEKIAKDDALTKLGSKKSVLASPAASAKSSPSAVLPRPSIDPTMPGIDVPAVVAPPGRTRATARMRQQGNSLSRPSSVHVDDFQRGVGAKQDLPTARSGGPGRGAHPGSSGQRGPSQGGPSLQKLLSDPAVVANLNNPQKLQQLLEQYPILVQALQSGGLR